MLKSSLKLNNTEDKLNITEDELNSTKDKLKKTEDKSNNTEALLNETRLELKNAIKHNKVFLWRIDSFNEILKEAKNGGKETIDNNLFYKNSETESFGYKLKVYIYPNGHGDGKNTHLSVFIAIMKGEYDAVYAGLH